VHKWRHSDQSKDVLRYLTSVFGYITRYDFVALDEIETLKFAEEEELIPVFEAVQLSAVPVVR